MLTRTRDKMWTFAKPFVLKSIGREIPAGTYRVATDEELIEGLSFPCFRRVATMIMVPGAAPRHIDTPRSAIDLAPTILDLFKLPPEPTWASSWPPRPIDPRGSGSVR